MDELLPLKWYFESPIDFEYKEYVLLAYLQKVENSFYKRLLSPHLLHMEKMVDELLAFQSSYGQIQNDFNKNRYVYFEDTKLQGEDNKLITEIRELVEFSIPQVQNRIDYGYTVLRKHNQLLF